MCGLWYLRETVRRNFRKIRNKQALCISDTYDVGQILMALYRYIQESQIFLKKEISNIDSFFRLRYNALYDLRRHSLVYFTKYLIYLVIVVQREVTF